MRFSFDKRPTVLYAFTPTCVWCERNLNNARALAQKVSPTAEFVGIALQSAALDEYVARAQLEDWTILTDLDDATKEAFGLGNTPQTIVVDVGGRVKHVWTGAYIGSVADQVKDALA